MTGPADKPRCKKLKPPDGPDYEAQRRRYDAYRASLPPNVSASDTDNPAIKYGAKKTEATIAMVISWLEKGYSKGFACDKAGISVVSWDKWKSDDEVIRERAHAAVERGTDLIEDEARRRAVEGTDKPVFQQGECVGFIREYSDTLMQMVLGGRRSAYRKTSVEMSGPNGGAIPHKVEVEFVSPKASGEKQR
jgi:hypothetical protein